MPASETNIRTQIARFANYAGYPDDPGLIELMRAFKAAADDDRHVKAIGDRLIATMHFCPKPADVYEASRWLEEQAVRRTQTSEAPGLKPRPGDGPFSARDYESWDSNLAAKWRTLAENAKAASTRAFAQHLVDGWDEYCARKRGAA